MWRLIVIFSVLLSCSYRDEKDAPVFQFVKDTFLNVNVKRNMLEFSFDGSSSYDLKLFTLPLKIYFNGAYLTIREPYIFVNPEHEVGISYAPDIYSADLPESFSRDSFYAVLGELWDSLEGMHLIFQLFSIYDTIVFLKVSPETLVLANGSKVDTFLGYRNMYLDLRNLEVVNISSIYDSTYHLFFNEQGFPYLNVYHDFMVALSWNTLYDTIVPTENGDVLHENDDMDAFLTDRYISIVGANWYEYTANHTLLPKDMVFFVRRKDGSLWVFEVLDYYNHEGSSGYFTIRYGKLK